MSPAERARMAYALADQAATALVSGNDPSSGYTLLARVVGVGLAGVVGTAEAAKRLNALIRELEAHGG